MCRSAERQSLLRTKLRTNEGRARTRERQLPMQVPAYGSTDGLMSIGTEERFLLHNTLRYNNWAETDIHHLLPRFINDPRGGA